ncbi:tripartite tricarboxylate transporter TctB family protein [Spiractinospora alimapuensis]|uniref:tripartite tricarboxylate transporter TctB family protein n=1 Tax=Spiractinospora alimapuensis TaxID=2820884 RepID=UPI001F261628|nr:tripartite tricarboxylate transporter TctB family protein [Spiractinospora alimapuensis]QVQ52639.1 tripartite tricarboxylate transporter TctB family protein [Spiractinospora alimapuensis]
MSEPTTPLRSAPAAETDEHGAGTMPAVLRRIDGTSLFYLVLTVVLAGYTLLAFDMEWDTQAGRIGPGFFPRIIGVAGVALAVIGLVNAIRQARSRSLDAVPAEPEDLRYPGIIAVIALGLGAFVTVLIPLGAPLTGAAFLVLMYLMIDRKRILRRAVLSVVFPLALYIVFDVLLGAALPGGITDFL